MIQNYYRVPEASHSALLSLDSAVCLALKSGRFNYPSAILILTLDPMQILFISFISELIGLDSHPY